MNSTMIRLFRALRAELDAIKRTSVSYRQGVVTTASPLAVTLSGSDIPLQDIKRLASYTPTEGDVVAVLVFGNDRLVLGEIA